MKVNNPRLKSLIQVSAMILISATTQVVSLLKSSLMASKYGANEKIDAYNVVYNITLFIFSFVATGITTVLIPAFVKKTNSKIIHTFLMTIYLGTIILSLLFILLKVPILGFFSNGRASFYRVANDILLVLLISQFFNTYTGVTTAYFQCINRFNLPKMLNLITSFLLVVLLWIAKKPSIFYLAIITGLTTVSNAVLQLFYSHHYGMETTYNLDFKNEEYRRMLKIYIPTIFSAGLYQVNLLLDSLLSSQTGSGNVTILTYSNSIIGMVNSLIIANLLVYLYPKISEAVNQSRKLAKKKLFSSISLMSFFVGIMVIAFFAVGKDLLSLLMLHGRFDRKSLDILYMCTCLYLIGFPFNVIRDVMYRFFYSLGDTRLTFYNSVIASGVNFIFSILLARLIGVYGVIMGTLISGVVSMIMIVYRYNIRYKIVTPYKSLFKELFGTFVPVLIISGLLITVYLILSPNFWESILFAILSILVYTLIIYLLKGEVYKYFCSILSKY